MQRNHSELHIIERHYREAKRIGNPHSKGHFRKRDAYDCGHTGCGVCHFDKRFGHKETRQARLSALRLKD